jgi:EAL domain-containing protein (putative c-di-GMP-specific phosphodiesterase class I)
MRMANDEFVIASVVNVGDAGRSDYIVAKLESAFEEINKNRDICCDVGIYYAHASGLITTNDAMEHLVNDAINQKNQIKARLSGKGHSEKVVTEEDLKRDAIVKHILDENLFMYYFQPIVSARDGSIFAYEALMRADVPERISPVDILESAERLGRLYDVEKHTMFNVLRCIEKNPEMFEDKKVFINSIPGYVLEAEDREMFVKRLKGLTCKGIVIELTERDELGDSEIEGLKTFMEAHNLEFAIDDYGSGYSNVNNLLRYMPDYVKIDRMLLTGIDNDAHRQHFVKDIIEFTQDNDIMALAEGVETTKEMKTVIQLGTNLIQGYYTAKPKPEIIQQVQPNITNEIVQYNQSDMITDNNKVFVMEHDSSVSLMTMATENYREIVLRQSATKDGPVHIIGAPGFMSDITLTIEEKFVGTVILQNASFAGEKMMPCIECGAGADVTLVLEGNNTLRTGGIKVPESAKLTVKGEGNLKIDLNNSRYYGIGNDLKSKHGVLNFEQDGTININAKGMTGVAIGSGYGQNIRITRGRFDLHIFGQNGVAIGSVYAPADVVISDTDMDINYEVSHGAVIGSYKQGANVDISTSSINVKCAGNKYSAFGSLEGDFCQVRIDSAHVEVNARGRESKVIGSQEGPVNTQISDSSIRMTIQGSECMAVGNPDRKGHFKNSNSDLAVTVKNNSGVDIALKESDIELINGRYMFMVNNENIERKVREIF